jgi:transcriptional regulator with XRE-family HTH domain
MLAQEHQSAGQETLALRQEAGKWLRQLRENIGISQRELAKRVGLEYYTFISQIESGRGRIPPTQMRAWAEVLGVPARKFGIEMMRYYDPISHDMIFGSGAGKNDSDDALTLEGRIRRLEDMLEKAVKG